VEVKLIVVGGKSAGRAVPVTGPKFLIGRAPECHLRPQSDRVSRRHAVILLREGAVAVRDLGSSNGTFVNDERIDSERELKTGDHLKIGPLEFEVQLSVSLGGKRKSKVHNVQEAAARTVESAADKDEDIISDWLADEEDEGDAAAATTQTFRETLAAKKRAAEAAAKAGGSPKKETGPTPFSQQKKPAPKDTRDAANEMLKRFFENK